ncbi:heme A synthase [Dokdonia sinensis]|uniref:Heme A synthase n=1 Tax=Dokdonia sinensis TaxID=2479847 RepID=A0A3M0G5Y7_9FLAO|nr:COX15/CtaA family protein [Dokdonia sinensis]RMB57682.1 heme A synthase [Dokdonia sinensis]
MWYRNSLKISIIFLYLIIVAGAVVRMTGSGMGCPDWPKCFGYYIPPQEEADLEWEANRFYKEGQVIIRNKELRVASADFETTSSYNAQNWERYTKHDYSSFNKWHTWIEYINRLVTVLAGIPMLLMVVFAFWYWKGRPWLIFASFLVLPLMGFQAWLGKLVVDSNLTPVKITIHMIAALVIAGLLLFLWFKLREREVTLSRKRNTNHTVFSERDHSLIYDPTFKYLMLIAVMLTLVQVAMGTQVRQYVDERVSKVGYEVKSLWLDPPTLGFYVHRSFSILVTLLNVYVYWRNRKLNLGHTALLNWVLILIGLEVITGVAMYYLDFPFTSQPLHLVIAALLFGVQFYLVLQSFRPSSDRKGVSAL